MRDCARPATPLTGSQARALLEPYFEALRELALEYERRVHGESRASRVRFVVVAGERLERELGFNPRNYAGTRTDGTLVCCAAELVEQSDGIVAALLAHEWGHALDYLHPGQYVLVEDELHRQLAPADRDQLPNAQAAVAQMRRWEARDADEVERVADLVAEAFTGRPVHYAGECVLQTWGPGTARPVGLR